MNFIKRIIEKHKAAKREREFLVLNCADEINLKLAEAENIFINQDDFIEPEKETFWNESLTEIFNKLSIIKGRKYTKLKQYKDLLNKKNALLEIKANLKKQITKFNEELAEKRIDDAYLLIGDVEGRQLDRQQMKCVVMDAHNQLIIAGAGTGKTTTIVGKIKYLLKTGKCAPEDILVLSFTNASASEMKERICKETNSNIEASTFHKLGLNIITKVNGIAPKISKISLSKFIKERLENYMKDKGYLNKLTTYLLYNSVVDKSEFDFESEDEYEEYLKLNPPVTMKNEKVKSYGELKIANFLFQNGINYIYEAPYKIDTRTEEYGQYYPDFYLPDYDIYLEYFGIKYLTAKYNMD